MSGRTLKTEPWKFPGEPATEPPKKAKPCVYCEQGYKLRHGNEHFIVKSIIPAHIKIVKCKAVTQ